jgi:hypothetical protein
VEKFGQAKAQAGYRLAAEWTGAKGFRENLVRPGTYTHKDFDFISKDMTVRARADWDALVDRAVSGRDQTAAASVSAVTFYNLTSVNGEHIRPTGPAFINRKVALTTFAVTPAGGLSLGLTSDVDLRLTAPSGNILVHLHKDMTMFLLDTPSGWKVDGWNGKYTAAPPSPDAS